MEQQASRSSSGKTPLLLVLIFSVPALLAQDTPPEYVGSESCGACHSELYEAFPRGTHGRLDQSEGKWKDRMCESCHGPGEKHVESMDAATILNPGKLAPAAADKNCIGCHLNTKTQVGRLRGGHGRNQVACVTCHPIHSEPEFTAASPKGRINEQCASCHTDVWASFQRPHGHNLPQGAISCVDCHNPHGAFFPTGVRTVSANEPGCIRCHGDKRGPFVFEHAPVRMEGCMSCHVPHGSANPRMLTRHEVSGVCLECHSDIGALTGAGSTGAVGGVPPAFHNLQNPRYRNCTMCHQKIHGSQVNRDFLR